MVLQHREYTCILEVTCLKYNENLYLMRYNEELYRLQQCLLWRQKVEFIHIAQFPLACYMLITRKNKNRIDV